MLIGISPINAVTQTEQAQPSQEQAQPNQEQEPQVFTLPDIIPTSEAEEKGYVGRDTESETDLNTFVFKNADGTNTLRLFDHPVKYVDENGVTKDISLELKRENNGSFVSTDHEISTTFSKNLSDGIELEYEDISIKLLPQTSTAKSTLSTATMPIASVSSDSKSVTYPVDTKTSYEYELTYAGFKEDIVVSEYTGVTEYNFILQTNGLTLTKIQESYFLTDEKGEIKANIGDIIVFTADERNNTMGSMTYQTVKANEIYAMTIHLDADYLSDPDTKYPIRIDPTIEINYDNNGAGAIQDVTINSLDPNDSSGDSGSLYVGLRNTYGISRVLMRFPNLSLSSISSASAITAATVELRDVLCPSTATTVTCHPFTGNSWTDSNATWNTVSPNSYGTQLSSNAVSYSNGVNLSTAHRYSFSILAAVKGWKNGTYTQSKGLIFKSNAETTTKHATFASYNRSVNKPSLSITYLNSFVGTCFLSNAEFCDKISDGLAYGKFMQTNSDSSSGICEVSEFTGFFEQKWSIEQISTGYYKIKSVINNSVVTAPSSVDGNITFQTYTGASNQLWSIVTQENGSFKFYPKSNLSYCMSLESGTIGSGDYNIKLRASQTDSRDEWYICYVNGSDGMLMGIYDENHDHYSALGNIMPNLVECGYSNFNYIDTSYISVSAVKEQMSNSRIYVSRTHGNKDNNGTFIGLSDYDGLILHSTDIYNFSNNTSSVDLSNCELMLFIACFTGANENNSLPHAAVAAGAEVAIGFKESINCSKANAWTEYFFTYYEQGYSVEYCAREAAVQCSNAGEVDSYRIVRSS